MKKIIFYCSILLGTAFTGCSDYLNLEPEDVIESNHYWETANAAALEQYCNTFYPKLIIGQGNPNTDGAMEFITVDCQSDNIYSTGANSIAWGQNLLTTSDTAFSKADGYALTTYEKEEGDADGPFALAVSVEAGEGRMIWFSSSYFLENDYNAYSSGANADLAMNAVAALVGETEAMAIRSKSLNYSYLSITESTASLLKTLMIGVFPLAYLGVGVVIILKRRRTQNEAA